MDATTEEMNEVYGPPSWFTEPEAVTTFEEPLREEGVVRMETETEPLQLAGEPLIETEPVALSGDVPIPTYDLNGDNVSNAADLTMMKRALRTI